MKCTDCNGTGQIALLYSISTCDCVNRAEPAKDPYRGFVEPEAKLPSPRVRSFFRQRAKMDVMDASVSPTGVHSLGDLAVNPDGNLEILKARSESPDGIVWDFANYPGAAKLDEGAWYSPRSTRALGLGPYWQTPEGQAQLIKTIKPIQDQMAAEMASWRIGL